MVAIFEMRKGLNLAHGGALCEGGLVRSCRLWPVCLGQCGLRGLSVSCDYLLLCWKKCSLTSRVRELEWICSAGGFSGGTFGTWCRNPGVRVGWLKRSRERGQRPRGWLTRAGAKLEELLAREGLGSEQWRLEASIAEADFVKRLDVFDTAQLAVEMTLLEEDALMEDISRSASFRDSFTEVRARLQRQQLV